MKPDDPTSTCRPGPGRRRIRHIAAFAIVAALAAMPASAQTTCVKDTVLDAEGIAGYVAYTERRKTVDFYVAVDLIQGNSAIEGIEVITGLDEPVSEDDLANGADYGFRGILESTQESGTLEVEFSTGVDFRNLAIVFLLGGSSVGDFCASTIVLNIAREDIGERLSGRLRTGPLTRKTPPAK